MTDIEQLKKETDEIKKWLEDLKKNVSLSESEKKEKAEKLKSQAEITKQRIQAEIDLLSDKTDDESKRKKEEAEALLNTFNETMNLYASVLTSSETKHQNKDSKDKTEDEEKWFLKKTWEWISDKRSNIPKWGKAVIGAVWARIAWSWLYKKCKKRFWKDEKKEKESDDTDSTKKEEKKEEKPWWKKFLLWTWIGAWAAVWWVALYKNRNSITSSIKEKLWLALNFDEARYKVECEIRNWIVKDDNFWSFCAHFEGISYDESTQEIDSFWQKTKIDKKNKKIEWMDVQFRSREELFHAVNIVNFAKKELRWRWKTVTPFSINKISWDINFDLSESGKKEFIGANWSNFWTWVLWLWWAWWGWLLGGYFLWLKWWLAWVVWGGLAWYTVWSLIDNTSTMWRACWTIAKGVNLDKFVNYLNEQNIRWEQKEVYEQDDTTPIHECFNKVKQEIDDAFGDEDSARRDLKIEWDENNPEIYILKSYNQEVPLKLEWCTAKKWEKINFSKIKKISLWNYTKKMNSEKEEYWWNWLNIDFPHSNQWLEEAIRVANLTNKIRNDWSGRWAETYPFLYWKYNIPFALEIDTPWLWSNKSWWTTILSNEALKSKYPTLNKDLRKSLPILASTCSTKKFQEKMHDQAIHDKLEWSQYIKYLHQMGQWHKRKQ